MSKMFKHPLNVFTLGAGLVAALALNSRAADYASTVIADGPLAYYSLNDAPRSTTVINVGSLGAAGNGTNLNSYPVGGAIVGNASSAAYFGGNKARRVVPFNTAFNPPASQSFTIEAWFYVAVEVTDAPGPCPLFNRQTSGDRSGWVYFQRSPGTGWNFRMYKGTGSTVGVDITGQSSDPNAGKAGTWNHVVTVWDGPASTATMYVNGAEVKTLTAASDSYIENRANNSPSMSIGSYDNGDNSFNGAVDEVAFYSKKLTAAQILAHYQNATNAARTVSYPSLILGDAPVEYLRMEEKSMDKDLAINFGSIGNAGDATNAPGVLHPVPGLGASSGDTAASYRSKNSGGGATTIIPWKAQLNPDASQSFTIESWIYVNEEVTDAPGPAPLMNRYSYSGVNRQGWVYFQRSPATGWNFRMYSGSGSSVGVGITGQSTKPDSGKKGTWNHLVTVWDGPNATATMFVNGDQVAQGSGTYAANTDDHDPAEAVRGAAGLGIGSYNNTEPGANAFNGRVDEVAFYNSPLTPETILAHYQAGTNSLNSAAYGSVVLADKPLEYLRFSEPAYSPAINSGTLGHAATGVRMFTDDTAVGPVPPTFGGFFPLNGAAAFDSTSSYIYLASPTNLNFKGPITLEAWVKPNGVQPEISSIISHGSDYTQGPIVTLGILGGSILTGTNYAIAAWDTTSLNGASFPVPAEDLAGNVWVHLAGTYDGAKWTLYRNGVQVGAANSTVGAIQMDDNWSIGARSDGKGNAFNGAIDEPAIYNKALSAASILAHYNAGKGVVAPVSIAIARSGTSVTLTWTGTATLQQADTVNGTYTDVTPAASGISIQAAAAQKYYRLKQ